MFRSLRRIPFSFSRLCFNGLGSLLLPNTKMLLFSLPHIKNFFETYNSDLYEIHLDLFLCFRDRLPHNDIRCFKP